MVRLNKYLPTRTPSNISDSASDSSLKGGTNKTVTSVVMQTDVVEERERGFWDEFLILRHKMEEGPSAFFEQLGSAPLSVKAAVSLLPILCILIIIGVCLLAISSSSLAFAEPTALPSEVPSSVPSNLPSFVPSDLPSMAPTNSPTANPSLAPTRKPSSSPSIRPTFFGETYSPSDVPSDQPSSVPSNVPSSNPSSQPTPNPTPPPTYLITYVPGKLTVRENGLLLSEGLKSRLVARTGERVVLDGRNNELSEAPFHDQPDGAAVFADPNSDGGWVYVSNSEVQELGQGGVGGIYFDKDARTVDYRMLMNGTTANCSGGKTPWNTWVSCEETEEGRVFQIDPFGQRGMAQVTMDRGFFEAFAHDVHDKTHPRFFVTEDKERGPIRRFSPSKINWDDPWELLHGPGLLQYLVIEPKGDNTGTFRWTTNKVYAKSNAAKYYPYTEGIDVYGRQLFFTSKERRELYILNLDDKTYEKQSTASGIFDGTPDQVKRIAGDGLLYFCEEAGIQNGVHARDENGWFFTVLETDTFKDESTGLAFSPDGKRMYVSFQHSGKIFDIWREDGLPFNAKTLNVRYHEFRQR